MLVRRWVALVAGAAVLPGLASCGKADGGEVSTVRIGIFANITQAPVLLALDTGAFRRALGPGVDVDEVVFGAGPDAAIALLSGAVDLAFLGPAPTINAFARSGGEALRIVAGTASGGARFVVRQGIDGPEDLRGATIATPQLGNTQDVALRSWLRDQGVRADSAGAGDVEIRPMSNADALSGFRDGTIDGAWVPEPWASRLRSEGDGVVLVDERDLWPGREFVTTHLVARTELLDEHPAVVRGVIEGLVGTIEQVGADVAGSQRLVNEALESRTTKGLATQVLTEAWGNLTFTWDPIAASLPAVRDHAHEVGLLGDVSIEGIYDLRLLDAVLAERDLAEVRAA